MSLVLYDLAGAADTLRFSPYCWRVKLACAHKALALETVPWRFAEKDRLPRPNDGQVPVLVDGDVCVCDSWKIAQYLDQRYPERPLFDSPQARSEALLIKYWVEGMLHPRVSRMIVADIWRALHPKDQAYFRESREKRYGCSLEEWVADREQTRDAFRASLEPLRAMLRDQPFIAGAAPAFADYILLGMFQWARCSSSFELLADDDLVWAYLERLSGLFDGLIAGAP